MPTYTYTGKLPTSERHRQMSNALADTFEFPERIYTQADLDAAVRAERDGIRSLAVEVAANTRGPSEYDLGYRDCALFFDAAIRERGE